MREMKNSGLSRRELIKCGLAGLAVTAGHGALSAVPQVSTSPPQAAGNGDLALVNGKFVDGRGVIASALTIKNGRIVNVHVSALIQQTFLHSIPGCRSSIWYRGETSREC